MIKFLKTYLKLLPHRKVLHKLLVCLYIHFHGNNKKIIAFLQTQQTIPKLQLDEYLESIDFDKYLTPLYPFSFIKECIKQNKNYKEELVLEKNIRHFN